MAPRRTSFASSLPPILDGTTFGFAPTPPQTPNSRPMNPKSLPKQLSLSASPPGSPERAPLALAVEPLQKSLRTDMGLSTPFESDREEVEVATTNFAYAQVLASSPVRRGFVRSTTPESLFLSTPCSSQPSSRSNSPSPYITPSNTDSKKISSTTTHSPTFGESHVAGMYFMKPLVIGVRVKLATGVTEKQSPDSIRAVPVSERNSTPSSKHAQAILGPPHPNATRALKDPSTSRGRRHSSPVRILADGARCPSRQVSHLVGAKNNENLKMSGQKTGGNLNWARASGIPSRSAPSSPVTGRCLFGPRSAFA